MAPVAVLVLACGSEVDDRHAAQIVDSARSDVVRFWESYRRATRLRLADSADAAIEALTEALAIDSGHEDALYYLGHLQFAADRFGEAESAWLRLVAVNPHSARGALQLGLLYACPDRREFFRPADARARLTRALAINQEETGPPLRLGLLDVVERHDAAARQRFEAVLRSHPESREAHVFSAFVAWRAGHDSLAGHHVVAARRADTDRPPPAGVRGEGDTRSGQRYWTATTACPSLDRALEALMDGGADWRAVFDSLEHRLP